MRQGRILFNTKTMDAMFKEDEHKVAAIFLRSKAIFAAFLVGTWRVQGILAMYGFIMGSLRRFRSDIFGLGRSISSHSSSGGSGSHSSVVGGKGSSQNGHGHHEKDQIFH